MFRKIAAATIASTVLWGGSTVPADAATTNVRTITATRVCEYEDGSGRLDAKGCIFRGNTFDVINFDSGRRSINIAKGSTPTVRVAYNTDTRKAITVRDAKGRKFAAKSRVLVWW